jgi:hypothetical protein
LRIDRTSPDGIWCVDVRGNQVLVQHEDLKTGRARRVPGIRQAIDVEYLLPTEFERRVARGDLPADYPYVLEHARSSVQAERFKREAIQAYVVSDMPGNESKLFWAVRWFQKALAHYNMRYLPDPAEDKIRQEAAKKLMRKVNELYDQAIILEKRGELGKASATYERILDYVPERDNFVYRNVSQRLTAVRIEARKKRR